MFQTKVLETTKTQILCPVKFSEIRAFYDKMWKSMVKADRPQMTL